MRAVDNAFFYSHKNLWQNVRITLGSLHLHTNTLGPPTQVAQDATKNVLYVRDNKHSKHSNLIFGKIWEFGPTRAPPPPLTQSWDAQN